MVDPASGPFLFDTSAESWLARTKDSDFLNWMHAYLSLIQFMFPPSPFWSEFGVTVSYGATPVKSGARPLSRLGLPI